VLSANNHYHGLRILGSVVLKRLQSHAEVELMELARPVVGDSTGCAELAIEAAWVSSGLMAGRFSCCRVEQLLVLPAAPAVMSTPPAECILDFFAGLLQVARHLIGPALGLKTPVAGDLASVPLDTAAQCLGLVPELIREAHNSLLSSSSRVAGTMHETPPTRLTIRRSDASRGVPIRLGCWGDWLGESIR
jgi:hypothetical protein